jgi:hypothetical protein
VRCCTWVGRAQLSVDERCAAEIVYAAGAGHESCGGETAHPSSC